MPFDCLPASTSPTLADLSRVLRNPAEWPPGFVWDFTNYRTCAIGLFQRVIGDDIGKLFDIDSDHWFQIFLSRGLSYVTPSEIADRIDAYLAEE